MTGELAIQNEESLIQELNHHGCPVCNRIWVTVFEDFSGWILDLIENEDAQNQNAEKLGLCPFHTWQMASLGSPQGISLGYAKLAERISEKLLSLSQSDPLPKSGISFLIQDGCNCRACLLTQKTETFCLTTLKDLLADDDYRKRYAKSDGLCLRHLNRLLPSLDFPTARFLIGHSSDHFRKWAENMRQYWIKHKTLQRHLISRDEKFAYLYALTHLASNKYVNTANAAEPSNPNARVSEEIIQS